MPPQNQSRNADGRQNERAVLMFPYYSMVRLKTTRSGAGPFTYTGDTTPKRAFSYKIGDVMDAAGFPAATIATKAETNLQAASQTNQSSEVEIWGLSISIAKGEPKLIREFFRVCVVEISLSGVDTYLLGPLYFFPQVGGAYGMERTKLAAGPDNDPNGPMIGMISNGNPNAGSFLKLPEPLVWQPPGAGKDSSLTVTLTPTAAISVSSTDRAAVAGAAPGASGQVDAFTSPADGADGTFLDLMIRLHTVSKSKLSVNG